VLIAQIAISHGSQPVICGAAIMLKFGSYAGGAGRRAPQLVRVYSAAVITREESLAVKQLTASGTLAHIRTAST
jgi:hypothetical protein